MLNLTTLKSVAAYDLIKVKLRTDADGTSRFLPHALPHTLPSLPLFSLIPRRPPLTTERAERDGSDARYWIDSGRAGLSDRERREGGTSDKRISISALHVFSDIEFKKIKKLPV